MSAIQQVMAAQAGSSLFTGLVEYWNFDEASGNRAGAHAGLTLTDNNSVGSATGVGGVGIAAQFNNASSHFLQRASQASLQTGNINWALNVWVYLDSKSQSIAIGNKGSSNTVREWFLQYVQGTDRFRFLVYDGAGNLTKNVSADAFGSPALNTWHMLTAQHNAVFNTASIHVNAATTDALSPGGGAAGTNTGPFTIGASVTPTFQYWDGRIAYVGFWKDRLLDAAARTQLYNAGAAVPYSALT
jgi:hypothetical protein